MISNTTRPGRSALVAIVLLAAVTLSCRERLESTVTGRVTYLDAPLKHALLNFHFKGRGPIAYGMTDELGNYELLTGATTGLLAGTYLVAIQPPEGIEIPANYWQVNTSGLEYDVDLGSNEIDIHLK